VLKRDSDDVLDREALLARLREAEETLEAIRNGTVDAVVVSALGKSKVFTLEGADHPYRIIFEVMNEGALSLDRIGTILHCNDRFAELLQRPARLALGTSILQFIRPSEKAHVEALLAKALNARMKCDVTFTADDGTAIPTILSLSPLPVDGGPMICAVVTDLRDLNARRAAEAAEQRARELVRRLEASQVDLSGKIGDLEKAHDVMVGRELKMIQLEKQMHELRNELNQLKRKS
jgi:formate hydrogenlyase transcriptional activator